jgi:hypothetical protein
MESRRGFRQATEISKTMPGVLSRGRERLGGRNRLRIGCHQLAQDLLSLAQIGQRGLPFRGRRFHPAIAQQGVRQIVLRQAIVGVPICQFARDGNRLAVVSRGAGSISDTRCNGIIKDRRQVGITDHQSPTRHCIGRIRRHRLLP